MTDLPEQLNQKLVSTLYDRFAAGDMDAMLELLSRDVEWVNAPKSEHTRGKTALRAHWERQWKAVGIDLTAKKISQTPQGVLVEVLERVSTHNGVVLFEGMVGHAYTIERGLISRCDIVDV